MDTNNSHSEAAPFSLDLSPWEPCPPHLTRHIHHLRGDWSTSFRPRHSHSRSFHFLELHHQCLDASGRDRSLNASPTLLIFLLKVLQACQAKRASKWPPITGPGTKPHHQVSTVKERRTSQMSRTYDLRNHLLQGWQTSSTRVNISDALGYEGPVAILNSATVTWKQPEIIQTQMGVVIFQ